MVNTKSKTISNLYISAKRIKPLVYVVLALIFFSIYQHILILDLCDDLKHIDHVMGNDFEIFDRQINSLDHRIERAVIDIEQKIDSEENNRESLDNKLTAKIESLENDINKIKRDAILKE